MAKLGAGLLWATSRLVGRPGNLKSDLTGGLNHLTLIEYRDSYPLGVI
ncbi:hypothetical protein IAD21_02466 [Abditibacteriota bacterium]|nr:hypothetical protein IAD21_02466 [Abditibacteriota bacterium]